MMKNNKKSNDKNYNVRKIIIAVAIALVAIVAVVVAVLLTSGEPNNNNDNNTKKPNLLTETEAFEPVKLDDNFEIVDMGKYSGIYMEDGSNDSVTDVFMIKVKNISEKDLQLARINLKYADFTAEFEVTNLPVGDTAVLLEKNRNAYIEGSFKSSKVLDVVYFENPMSIKSDVLKITGNDGVLIVENISDKDIDGDFYIYYKYSLDDVLYGGITFRSKVASGIKAGEVKQVAASHFDDNGSVIVDVGIY